MDSDKTKNQFSLSKSNKIYLGITVVIYLILFLTFSSKTSDAFGFGRLSGKLVGLAIFPSIFAWIAWRLSGRPKNGGSWTFNICLTLLLLGQISQSGEKVRIRQSTEFMQEQKNEFKERFSSLEDPAEYDSVYNEYRESVKKTFSELSESTTGKEKQVFEILNDHVTYSQSIEDRWSKSYDAIISEQFFDFSRLDRDEEFDFQIRTATHYVTETKIYAQEIPNSVSNLKERLRSLGAGNKMAIGAIKGLSAKYDLQKPLFEALMEAHIEYGNCFIQILELLKKNKKKWKFENNETSIYDDNVLSRYNELSDILTKKEELINRLGAQLIEKF